MRLRIKYCGGCNAAYDRTKFVNRLLEELKARIPEELEISYSEQEADCGVIVCGCSTCCADNDENKANITRWHIVGPDSLDYLPCTDSEIIHNVSQSLIEILQLPSASE